VPTGNGTNVQANLQTNRHPSPARPRYVEAELLDFIKRLERNSYEWRAAHIQLSNLRPRNRRDYQIRIAASEFEAFLGKTPSQLFWLRNGDLVLVWQGEGIAEVDQIILRLRYLFSDDPLLSNAIVDPEGRPDLPADTPADGAARARFCDWYDLERDFDLFRELMQRLVTDIERRRFAPGQASAGRPLEPVSLAQLEGALGGADLSSMIRRQPVCLLLPRVAPQIVFHEVHVAIGDIARRLLPGVDLTADTWLFQHLAATLDERLLPILASDGRDDIRNAISVNLRLSTLLSEHFLRFDSEFRRRHKVQMVIELQLVDIYSEFGGFIFIRDFLRERGYRICIDGLHHLHLPLIDRKRLGVDMAKLVWSPDMLDESGSRAEQLRDAIRQTGKDRLVLCRCDTAEAISWGQAMGIRLFQGHYIDSKLRAARSPAVAAARQALRSSSV
jgi:EAL domain-containing protein (putative c-di-GMP-specific phosphodiesterase class I)